MCKDMPGVTDPKPAELINGPLLVYDTLFVFAD